MHDAWKQWPHANVNCPSGKGDAGLDDAMVPRHTVHTSCPIDEGHEEGYGERPGLCE